MWHYEKAQENANKAPQSGCCSSKVKDLYRSGDTSLQVVNIERNQWSSFSVMTGLRGAEYAISYAIKNM